MKHQKITLQQFDYILPQELIAQKPIYPRDHSRLLVYQKKIIHDHFYNLDRYLNKGDVLIFNDSKVIPARLLGNKESGGKIEIFLLNKIKNNTWHCLTKGKIKLNSKIILPKKFIGEILEINLDGTKIIKFNKNNILSVGETPLPPYIKQKAPLTEYQTIYAKHEGSVAAPTAGFHFTKSLLNKLKKKGVQIEYLTLHVGLGTFLPVKTKNILDHKMHTEYFSIKKETIKKLAQAKAEHRRIIPVGTTSLRTLESLKSLTPKTYNLNPTNIFIYPGYKFKYADAMITNFHLPKSSLLMLVSALAGTKNIKKIYQEAINKKYRFYSFGDGMLITK